MDAPDITAVMLTWNSQRHLPEVLAGLRAQRDVTVELVVVDNGSGDATLERLGTLQPDATVLRNPVNRGFAPGCNQGIAVARAPYVLLLNHDVVLDPGYCAALRRALEDDPGAAAATGTLFSDAARQVVDTTGHIVIRGGITANRHQGAAAAEVPAETGEVFGVSAAAALYRRAALEDVRGPDGVLAESFFSYSEDADLDWRLRWRGWRCLHVPAATAVHRRSASGAAFTTELRRRRLANQLLVVARVYPRAWLGRHGPDLLRHWGAGLPRTALTRPSDLAAYAMVLRRLPLALRVRRQVMRTRRVEPAALEPWVQPRPWPWLPWRR